MARGRYWVAARRAVSLWSVLLPHPPLARGGIDSAIAAAERNDSAANVSVPLLQPEETMVGAPTIQRFS